MAFLTKDSDTRSDPISLRRASCIEFFAEVSPLLFCNSRVTAAEFHLLLSSLAIKRKISDGSKTAAQKRTCQKERAEAPGSTPRSPQG